MKAFKFLIMEKGVNWRAQRTRGTFEADEKTLENTRLRWLKTVSSTYIGCVVITTL